MEKQDVNAKKYYTIDLLHILKFLWRKIWVVILAALIAGSVGFGISAFLIKPTYSSTILLYVNNASSIGGIDISGISISDINASQSLVKTYSELLKTRTVLNRVKDRLGLEYSTHDLKQMIESGSSNDTEIMYVKVTTNDRQESSDIANCIAEVLPERIDEIFDGASTRVVDYAVPNKTKDSPSITKYTAVGLFLGAMASIVVLAVIAMMDDRIHDEDYIIETYDYPILAKVPNLINADGKNKYSRYSKYYYYSRTYKSADYVSESELDESNASASSASDNSDK